MMYPTAARAAREMTRMTNGASFDMIVGDGFGFGGDFEKMEAWVVVNWTPRRRSGRAVNDIAAQ